MNICVLPELISNEHENDAGFLLKKNVFIRQMPSRGELLF